MALADAARGKEQTAQQKDIDECQTEQLRRPSGVLPRTPPAECSAPDTANCHAQQFVLGDVSRRLSMLLEISSTSVMPTLKR